MQTEKIFIKNRKGQNVRVCIDTSENIFEKTQGAESLTSSKHTLAFIMPGLGSHHNKPKFRGIAEILVKHGYVAISFDPTNSFGESDGNYEDATFTNYYEDFEDVIEWARTNPAELNFNNVIKIDVKAPYILIGHSLGGMGVTLYTERYPERVKALAPISATISGKLSLEARSKDEIEKWKTLSYQETKRSNGEIKKLKWSHMEDRMKYDNLVDAGKIHVPVLMVVGENDSPTPPKHQQLLFNAIGTVGDEKEIHIIEGADHELRSTEAHAQLMDFFEKWLIDKVLKKA